MSNAVCAISNLTINCGEEVVHLLLTQHPEHIGTVGHGTSYFWQVRTIPLYGIYDEPLVTLNPGQEALFDTIRRGFEIDLIDKTLLSYWSFEDLQMHERDKGLYIDPRNLSGYNRAEKANVCSIVIRRDVWDSFVNTKVVGMGEKYTIDEYKECADEVLDMTLLKDELFLESKILLNTNNDFVYRFACSRNDRPCTISNSWLFRDNIIPDLIKGNLSIEDARPILYRMAELAQVDFVMGMTNRSWHPTTTGPQFGEVKLSKQIAKQIWQIARNIKQGY
jgi:hypothetical protein